MLKAPIDVLLNAVIGLLKAFIRRLLEPLSPFHWRGLLCVHEVFVYLWYIFIKLF